MTPESNPLYKHETASGEKKTDQLKSLILTGEQYGEHPFGQGELGPVYLYEVRKGRKSITFFGSPHTNRVSDPVFDEIKDAFTKANPDIVYVEGMLSLAERAEQWKTKSKEISPEKAKHEGESIFTLKLAADNGVEFESPEPAFQVEIEALRAQGFSRKDIFLFNVYRMIDQHERKSGELSTEIIEKLIKEEAAYFEKKGDWPAGELRAIVANLKDAFPLSEDFYYERVTPIPSEGRPWEVTNEISKASSLIRDRRIFDRLKEGLKTHNRLFIVYGSAHAVKLEPALRALLEQEVKD